MAVRVLLVSRGIVHPSFLLRRRARALLSGTAAGALTTTRSLRRLSALGAIEAEPGADAEPSADVEPGAGGRVEHPAAVVLLFHEKEPPAGAVEALERYVRSGGGILAIHGALASFKEHPRYAALIGSPFQGHGKPGPVAVYAAGAGAAVARVTDELYRVDLTADAEVRYVGVATADDGDGADSAAAPGGEAEPICWERRVGKGRVAVVTLGHYTRTLADPFVRDLLREELERVAGVGAVAGEDAVAGGGR